MTIFYPLFKKSTIGLSLLLLLSGCNLYLDKLVDVPSSPLIQLNFEDEINNQGVLKVTMHGTENVSYHEALDGKALNLSATAKYRKPILINANEGVDWDGYQGLTVLVWVKMAVDDFNEYTIVSQMKNDEDFGEIGWRIENSACGTWRWSIHDGVTPVDYQPTYKRQPLNDGEWHLIGFSIDYGEQEVRLFYDGLNVAIYSLEGYNFQTLTGGVVIGSDPFSNMPITNVFNGLIDDFTIWSRTLTSEQMAAIYSMKKKYKHQKKRKMPDSLTIMTWNIWDGGQRAGKFVGVQRVAEMIAESGADIISLQEAGSSAPIIADMLGYFLYNRGAGLSVLSRYPLGKSYNVYNLNVSGAVTVNLPKNNQLIFCPISLSYLPNQAAYILSGQAEADTIIARELKTRGAEMRYIMWELQTLLKQKDKIPVIVAGETNTGSHLDWTARNKENRYGLVLDFPTSRIIEQSGFTDAYRHIYPDEVAYPGNTWSPLFQKVLHDRLSYIYYNSSRIEPISSTIIEEHPLFFPSDHSAVLVSFKWK